MDITTVADDQIIAHDGIDVYELDVEEEADDGTQRANPLLEEAAAAAMPMLVEPVVASTPAQPLATVALAEGPPDELREEREAQAVQMVLDYLRTKRT